MKRRIRNDELHSSVLLTRMREEHDTTFIIIEARVNAEELTDTSTTIALDKLLINWINLPQDVPERDVLAFILGAVMNGVMSDDFNRDNGDD